jgi:cleavage and polyadenylation specificity factor subunit 4
MFDDIEEEEESEEEDEINGPESQGRGRGRGMMWPPQMPMPRGMGPMIGGRGFPPNMMGDGFGFNGGFGMPDPFGMPRDSPPPPIRWPKVTQ